MRVRESFFLSARASVIQSQAELSLFLPTPNMALVLIPEPYNPKPEAVVEAGSPCRRFHDACCPGQRLEVHNIDLNRRCLCI